MYDLNRFSIFAAPTTMAVGVLLAIDSIDTSEPYCQKYPHIQERRYEGPSKAVLHIKGRYEPRVIRI